MFSIKLKNILLPLVLVWMAFPINNALAQEKNPLGGTKPIPNYTAEDRARILRQVAKASGNEEEYYETLRKNQEAAKAAEKKVSASTITTTTTTTKSAVAGGLSMGGVCSNAGNVFDIIKCKALQTLTDFRPIVYIIGGFGIIAFAFMAIFGKISFAHLSNIGIGLFLVAAMGPFIAYFTTSKGDLNDQKMMFGNWIPTNFERLVGTRPTLGGDCMVDENGECDEAGLAEKGEEGADKDGKTGDELKGDSEKENEKDSAEKDKKGGVKKAAEAVKQGAKDVAGALGVRRVDVGTGGVRVSGGNQSGSYSASANKRGASVSGRGSVSGQQVKGAASRIGDAIRGGRQQ